MSENKILTAESISKSFKIYSSPKDRLVEWIAPRGAKRHKAFWALKDISFDLDRGEALGILGLNGAGKSTLLKILTGSLYASAGTFQVNGRLLSLLELGTGFQPTLTGRENLYTSCRLMGFPRSYVDEKVRDIEEFADIGDYFDRPFRFYSSGMRARLGFSLFSFLECDLLIIDEVFAVGDIFFRQKCYQRLEELRSKNTAIILVTHNLPAVQEYCDRGIILDKGNMLFNGSAQEAVKRYTLLPSSKPEVAEPGVTEETAEPDHHGASISIVKAFENSEATVWPPRHVFDIPSASVDFGEKSVSLNGFAVCDRTQSPASSFFVGQTVVFYYELLVLVPLKVPITGIILTNEKNTTVHAKHTYQYNLGSLPERLGPGITIRVWQEIKLDIAPGEYSVAIDFCSLPKYLYDRLDLLSFPDFRDGVQNAQKIQRAAAIRVLRRSTALKDIPFMGICDLRGNGDMSILTH